VVLQSCCTYGANTNTKTTPNLILHFGTPPPAGIKTKKTQRKIASDDTTFNFQRNHRRNDICFVCAQQRRIVVAAHTALNYTAAFYINKKGRALQHGPPLNPNTPL
jgi:hypothetical protein